MAAYLADQVVCIGPGNAAESYLDLKRVISAAVLTQCDALHPGYGFLAERPELVEICNENGIVFIGPSADAIRRGGDKVQARALAHSLGISTGAGSSALVDVDEAELIADQVGFPVLMKAAAGGGGRGMVLVEDSSDIRESDSLRRAMRRFRRSVTDVCISNVLLAELDMWKCRSWRIPMATSFTWGNETARHNAGTRKWWKKLRRISLRQRFVRSCIMRQSR